MALTQDPCDYSGNCMLGCSEHAKNTLDLNYIPLAQQNGADLFPLHEVDKIEPVHGKGYRVHFCRLDPERPARYDPGSVIGAKVIVAAGTVGSNELLLRCRDVHQTLPNLSAALGRRFSGNGDFLLAMAARADRTIDPGRGPSITAGADFSTKNNRIFIEDLGFPDPFMWMLEGTLPTSGRLVNLARALKSYVRDALGIGTGRVAFEADRLFRGGATTRLLPFLGMGTDAADGRLRLKKGAVDIDWRPRRSKAMFREMVPRNGSRHEAVEPQPGRKVPAQLALEMAVEKTAYRSSAGRLLHRGKHRSWCCQRGWRSVRAAGSIRSRRIDHFVGARRQPVFDDQCAS